MLKVVNLNKSYPTFALQDVSFHLPKGYILGFIGANGAGKTTTLKSILNYVRPDSGTVEILGKDMFSHEIELKQDIGFMLGAVDFYSKSKINTIIKVYRHFYFEWSDRAFQELMRKFNIDCGKKVCELSAGMRVKLGIAMALSHNAKLLIFDEPTSGLDPVARDDLLDLFQEIVKDGERSILFSTHITSDLDKCAEYIVFIRDGRLIANDTKVKLIDSHSLIKGKNENLSPEFRSRMIGVKTNANGFSALILREKLKQDDEVQVEMPNLEDLMVYYNRENRI
jgi:ABC-2 type transport system ATP-binding protein